MTDLRETVARAIENIEASIDHGPHYVMESLSGQDLSEWERGVIADAAIAVLQPTIDQLARERDEAQRNHMNELAKRLVGEVVLERQRDAALDALKLLTSAAADAVEIITDSWGEEQMERGDCQAVNRLRQALAQIDAVEGEGR